jgi:predicted RNA-binding Zn ribbon-like protein
VNFNSHTDEVVGIAAALVNVSVPGSRRGRPFVPATGTELAATVNAALSQGRRHAKRLSAAQAERLAVAAVQLRRVFETAAAADVDAAALIVNRLLGELGPIPYLDRHDGEPWHLHYHSRDHDLPSSWAASCTLALATVIGGEHADRLGVCGASQCDRVYVDVSRNGTRRFCSTACQNRVKAAAHRARVAE